MADPTVQDIVKRYGGNFAGNGLATTQASGNPNTPQTFFDTKTKQNFTVGLNGIKAPPSQTGAPTNLFQKAGTVLSQTFGFNPNNPSFLQSAATKLGGYVVHTAQDVGAQAYRAVRTPYDLGQLIYRSHDAEQKAKVLRDKLDKLGRAYGGGVVSKEDYQRQLKDINQGFTQVNAIIKSSFQSGNAAKQDAIGVAQTAVNALTLGKYRALESVVKTGGKELLGTSPPIIEKTLVTVGKKLEDALSHIPSFRDLVAKNAAFFLDDSARKLAGETTAQFIGRNTKNIATGLLIKRPIVYQTNIGSAQDFYNHVIDGNYTSAVKDAAWVGAQAIGGGPVGWFFRNTEKYAGKIRALTSGKASFIDEVSKRIGNQSPAQIADYLNGLKTSDPKAFAKAEKTLRIAQEVNLRVTSEDAARAADAVVSHYDQHAINPTSLTPERLVADLDRWAKADAIARKLSPKGGAEYVAVRWDAAAKEGLAQRLIEAGDNFKDMADAMTELASQPGVGWGNNPILMAKIGDAIVHSESAEAAAAVVRKITTVSTVTKDVPSGLAKRLEKLGYSIAEPHGGRQTPKVNFKDTRRLVSAVANGSDIFDPTIAPQPQLTAIAGALRRFGFSPESNTAVAYDKLSEALVTNLNAAEAVTPLGVVGDDSAKGAKFILSRLQEFIDKQAPNPYLNIGTLGRGKQSALQDIRQMNIKEIQEALPGTTRAAARQLRSAILKSYTDVPLEFRGLGIKAFDYAYRVPGAASYFRIQSALRYTYNPFFRAQEVIETKMLSHLKANNLLWMKPHAELDRVSTLLDDSRIFTTGYTGEATQDLTVGRVHANLLKTQKRDLAGLALDIADKKGIPVEEMIQDHPDELADALRVVVQYPDKGVLNSALARTLNVVFFPMRYNLKVAGIVAKEVAKLPPVMQLAVLHSAFHASSWLKSPEGVQWQADHADALQLFSYFTPVQNLTSVLHTLTGGVPDSIGELGQLGGLPFGFISQILDAEGIIHLNTPYVDPKTGDVLPDYVPTTTKARAAVALQGFLNSLFTYPGRVIGLPGKAQMLRGEIGIFLKTGGSDYLKQIRTEDLTPLQQKQIEVLSSGDKVTQDQIDQLYTSPAPGQFSGYTLPPNNLPKPVKVLTYSEVNQQRAAGKSARGPKPKAQPLPTP
jgi:hypothetical protein